MNKDIAHLSALQTRISHERVYLAKAKTPQERDIRKVWVAQIEREIEKEKTFLGIEESADVTMTDDELLSELAAIDH